MLAKNPARKFHCIQWTKIGRDYWNKLPFRKGLFFFVWTINFFDSLSFAWYTSSSSALIDPLGGDIFLYGSFVLFSLDCLKVGPFAKVWCLRRSHAMCFRPSHANIQLCSTNLNYNIYARINSCWWPAW